MMTQMEQKKETIWTLKWIIRFCRREEYMRDQGQKSTIPTLRIPETPHSEMHQSEEEEFSTTTSGVSISNDLFSSIQIF